MELDTKDSTLSGLALAIIAFLIYANSLGNSFVWDDDIVILANSALKGTALSLFSGIDSGRTTDITPYYRPLTLLSFLIEGRLHDFTPYLVRLCNVLLHSANTFFVYQLIRSTNVHKYGALLAGLLFAIHPLNSETVDFNAGGRNTMLAALFVLTSYMLHLWSVRRGFIGGGFAGAVLFLAGLFSKETAIAILPFIGNIEVTYLCSGDPASRRMAFVRLSPYLFCIAIYLILRNNALSQAGVYLNVFPGLMTRLLDNIYIIPRYLLNVLWPGLLSPKYYVPENLHLYALPLVLAWLGIISLLYWLLTRGRSRATLFGLAWMVAFWLPVSGIFPIPSAPLADRYLYLPAIGIWLIIADQIIRLLLIKNWLNMWAVSATAFTVIALATVTTRHNLTWRSDVALFSKLIELYPEQAYGYHNLGCAYLDKVKDLSLAEKYFERALAIDPNFPRLRTQMGYVRLLQNDFAGALYQYNQAIHLNPLDAEALLNRGDVFERMGRYVEALDSYRRFLATPGDELPDARVSIKLKAELLSEKLLK